MYPAVPPSVHCKLSKELSRNISAVFSHWSRRAPSPVGWPASWPDLVCSSSRPTRWTWLIRRMGCGWSSGRRHSPLTLLCPAGSSEWLPRSSSPAGRGSDLKKEGGPFSGLCSWLWCRWNVCVEMSEARKSMRNLRNNLHFPTLTVHKACSNVLLTTDSN